MPEAEKAVALRLESVQMAYGAIQAIKGVSLEVRAGEVVSLIGANGAGKSTLLKGIVGLEPIRGGRLLIDGQDASRIPAHRRLRLGVALSPEGRGVFPDQTVRENLLLGAWLWRGDAARVQALIEREFQRFPRLRERANQYAGTMSGGEQQMLAISRALMSEPRVLLLDEPSLGLAPLVVFDIFQSIRALREQGLTILLVEQMARQALAVADRAYVLETGRVTLEGTGEQLLCDPQVRAAYLGTHGTHGQKEST
ncbi:MAG: ABC transporter ATP-binding protein [Burkholderiaceae bacterium]|jgi:branched-chain amino acid transport system ATP-binding protein|nr:ABC transporter ATP-binding protein [Burkholderiaceae bacterium]